MGDLPVVPRRSRVMMRRVADWFARVGLVGPALIAGGVSLLVLSVWLRGRQ